MAQPPPSGRDEPAGARDDAAPTISAPYRIDDDDRYSRLRLISWWRQERLAAARILVVGAGALGNEVIKNLALLGRGHDLPDRPRRRRAVEPLAVGPVPRGGRRPAEGPGGRRAGPRAQPRDHRRADARRRDHRPRARALRRRRPRHRLPRQPRGPALGQPPVLEGRHALDRRRHPGDPGGRQGLRAPGLGLLRVRDDRARLSAPQPPLQLPAPEARRDPRRQGADRPDDRLDDGGARRFRRRSSCCTACRSRRARPWSSTAWRNQFYTTQLPFRERLPEPRDLSRAGRAPAGPRSNRSPSSSRRRGRELRRAAHPGPRSRAGRRRRLPPVRLAGRGHAAADEGHGRRRRSARTAGSRPARARQRGRGRLAAGGPDARRGRDSCRTISCGSTGRRDRVSSSWPAIGTAARRVGGWAGERRRDDLRRDHGIASRCGCSGRTATAASRAWPTKSRARRPADLPRSPHGRRDRAARPQRHVRRARRNPAGQGMRRRGDRRRPSSGSPSRSRPSTTPTPRRASPTPTTPGRRSPASATGSTPTSTSWAGITPIPASGSSSRTTTCSSTSISSPSRFRWPTWSIPIQQTRGFFQWRDGGMAQVQGFYLTADRGDRIALARLVNDLENLPNPEGPGGAACLVSSPRGGADQDAHPTFDTAVCEFPRRSAPGRRDLRHARVLPGRPGRGGGALALPARTARSRSRAKPLRP